MLLCCTTLYDFVFVRLLAVIRVRFQNEFPAKFALADWGGSFKMKTFLGGLIGREKEVKR